ncbi:MAG: helicase-related protein, partial [Thermodesulfobacteriota bacterium]|nr:helicase-related protein [Thermodesulfobacteriota bacterium]
METSAIATQLSTFLMYATDELSKWLNTRLPVLDNTWWQSIVIKSLSYQQSQRVEQNKIFSLDQLDLAALLRILDQNWYQLSQKCNLSNQDRHFVKEMQTVRNRWAHINTHGIDVDDTYRDIDTLQRFVGILNPGNEKILEIKQFKISIIKENNDPALDFKKKSGNTDHENISVSVLKGDIKIGSVVALKSDPDKTGAVININKQGDSTRYTLFIDGKSQPFYLSQLQVLEQKKEKEYLPLKELHSLLTALQINHPSLSILYSLNAARIDFVPYQFRPALKIIRSDQPRLLIADGVGVGKTIEAGLILRELQARNHIESVLIICPKPLVAERKWEFEMKRFDERFAQLDGKALRYCIDETDLEGEWPDSKHKAILPFSLFDEKLLFGNNETGKKIFTGLLDLDPPPHFDLVIVDEAHHVRNSNTFKHKAVRYFCENAEAVVFLTATPIQLGNQDLFSLLNLLRPDLVIDKETFEHMAEPNPYINKAVKQIRSGGDDWNKLALTSLIDASNTSWGETLLKNNPVFQDGCNMLLEDNIPQDKRIALIGEIERFHSFHNIINRTRRRDIDNFCIRKPETIEVPFTLEQETLHDTLLDFQAKALSASHGIQNVKFMMSTIRRQASSSILGLAPFLSDILNRRLSKIQLFEINDNDLSENDLSEMEFSEELKMEAQKITELAANMSSDDPKFSAFWKIIEEKSLMENNKVIVFSTFRHTLAYIEQRLKLKNIRFGLVHGDVKDEDRLLLRKRFKLPKEDDKALDVMLFSEVGCEGLDYQFCDTIINYDLPWNPMRIEQRIGRIDRWGQQSEAVVIYNLITPGTIDAEIYNSCLFRIGIFEESIGECEEILGEIHKEIKSIVENFELSKKDIKMKLQQLSDNKVRKINEERELEEREHELFGVKLSAFFPDEDIFKSESYWLTPASLQIFVTNYLKKRLQKNDFSLGNKPIKTFRLSQDARNQLLKDFRILKPIKT